MPTWIHWVIAIPLGVAAGVPIGGFLASGKIGRLRDALATAIEERSIAEQLLKEEKANVRMILEAIKQKHTAPGRISAIEEATPAKR